jgi:hypothetical protein
MSPLNGHFQFSEREMQDEEFDTTSLPTVGNIELIDCDDALTSEAEVPDDPNRWTLPVIREASAVGVLLCMAPVVVSCIAASAICVVESFIHFFDE